MEMHLKEYFWHQLCHPLLILRSLLMFLSLIANHSFFFRIISRRCNAIIARIERFIRFHGSDLNYLRERFKELRYLI